MFCAGAPHEENTKQTVACVALISICSFSDALSVSLCFDCYSLVVAANLLLSPPASEPLKRLRSMIALLQNGSLLIRETTRPC